MKNITPVTCLAFIFFCACGPTAKVTTQKEYKDSVAIKSVHVIVVSDKETSACMSYYQRFFVDSLNRDGVKAEGTFYCCRDRKTDIKALLDSLGRGNLDFQTLLAVVMTKVVTGYGATSSRELQLVLYDVEKQEVTWKGKLSADFSWFVNDENYQTVAHKMTNSTLATLKYQEIIPL
jgi:hypothetical protein